MKRSQAIAALCQHFKRIASVFQHKILLSDKFSNIRNGKAQYYSRVIHQCHFFSIFFTKNTFNSVEKETLLPPGRNSNTNNKTICKLHLLSAEYNLYKNCHSSAFQNIIKLQFTTNCISA